MNPSDWITVAQIIFGAIIGTALFVWASAWWLAKKFSGVEGTLFKKIDALEDNILRKLEYHERHDDERFSQVRNEVWDIKVRNAARDGLTTTKVS